MKYKSGNFSAAKAACCKLHKIAGAAYHNTTRSCFMARRTQTIITETFIDLLTQKPLDKITVKDIIEKADISRNTFY